MITTNKSQRLYFQSFLKKAWLVPALVMSTLAAIQKPVLSAEDCPYKVYNSADKYADTIVTDEENLLFLLPMNLRTSIDQCTYFADEDAFVLYATLTWNHPWVENKPYRADVEIESTGNGGWSWKLVDLNPNLFQHLLTMGVVKGSVEWFSSSSSKVNETSSVHFTNQCHETIDVAVTYYDGSAWVTKGWWSVESGKTVKTDLTAKKPREYIYTHAQSRSFVWNGGQSSNAVTRSVVSDVFSYSDDGSSLQGSNLRSVGFNRKDVDFDDSVTDTVFICQ